MKKETDGFDEHKTEQKSSYTVSDTVSVSESVSESASASDTYENAHDKNFATVLRYYTQKISPTPSTTMISELESFVESMGHECCLKAIDIALDANARNWKYIKAILQDKKNKGIKSLAEWDAVESRIQKHTYKSSTMKDKESDLKSMRDNLARMEKFRNKLKE